MFAVAAKSDNEVFVGGDFHIAGGKPSPHLARWFVSPPPNIVAYPGTIGDSLLTGQTSSHSLTIKNIGGMVLSWNIAFADAQGETPLSNNKKHMQYNAGSAFLANPGDSTALIGSHVELDPGALPWARAEPSAGEFYPGDSVAVQVLLDAAGLPGGGYDAILTVGSNHPYEPAISIPIHLDVAPAPDIAISDAALGFGVVAIGSSSRDTLHVWNAGSDTLRVYYVSVDSPRFTIDASAFPMLPGDSVPIEVTFTPTGEGPITGDLVIACNDPDRGIVHVALSGEGKLPVRINVSPDSLIQTLPIGLETVQTLTIDNIGPGPFDYLIAVRGSAANNTSAAAIECIYELRRWLLESKGISDDHGAADALEINLTGLRI
ncbi:MAG: choice-of-anchor D domain-containing protein, partial [Chitinivibrionia bacterium]|nr:choice-of-anchor D domain-containing protein [Chitinivibrionia bacterium]